MPSAFLCEDPAQQAFLLHLKVVGFDDLSSSMGSKDAMQHFCGHSPQQLEFWGLQGTDLGDWSTGFHGFWTKWGSVFIRIRCLTL